MLKEQRRMTMGLSRGNWITLGIFLFGLISAAIAQAIVYGGQVEKIDNNTEKIEKLEVTVETVRKEIKTDMKDLEGRLNNRMDRNSEVQRDRHNELLETIRAIK